MGLFRSIQHAHYLGRHAERYAQEIAEANLPEIRQFYVPEKADGCRTVGR